MQNIKVSIVDDHMLVLSGLQSVLGTIAHITIISSCRNAAELMDSMHIQLPDVIIMDIQMPGMDGLRLCKHINTEYPGIKILALSNLDEKQFVTNMIRNGAAGYLLKTVEPDVLLKAIEVVYQGGQFIQDELKDKLIQLTLTGKRITSYRPALTRREKEVLQLIAQEFSNQQIADKLFLSIRTVENHRFNLMQKLDVKNVAGLVKEALEGGLV